MSLLFTFNETLEQIVSEVEKMPDEEQQFLLIQLRKKEALRMARAWDNSVLPTKLTNKQLDKIVADVRQEMQDEQ